MFAALCPDRGTGKRNERAATMLALVKAVKCWEYLSFLQFDTRQVRGASGSFVGQIKCLVINCKAIFGVEKQNTFTVNASIQRDLEKINLYLKGLESQGYNLAKLSSHD